MGTDHAPFARSASGSRCTFSAHPLSSVRIGLVLRMVIAMAVYGQLERVDSAAVSAHPIPCMTDDTVVETWVRCPG